MSSSPRSSNRSEARPKRRGGGGMTQVTCYGGVAEIGGNKAPVEDRDARVGLDMGSSFGFGSAYWGEFLGPRDRFGLRDHFALGLLPKLPGLYSAGWLEGGRFA